MNNSKILHKSIQITTFVILMSCALALPSQAAPPPETLPAIPPTVLKIDTNDGNRLYIITGTEDCKASNAENTCTVDLVDIISPYEYSSGAASAQLNSAQLDIAGDRVVAGWRVESTSLTHNQSKVQLTVKLKTYGWAGGYAWTNGFSYQAFVLMRLRG